jgi:hypothetical protein
MVNKTLPLFANVAPMVWNCNPASDHCKRRRRRGPQERQEDDKKPSEKEVG